MSHSGDDDVVVRELDVYLADNLDLYLLQYMLRPAYAPAPNVKHAQFKPKHKVLEIFTEHDAKRNGLLKLTSSQTQHKAQIGVAILSEDGLHISPVQGVLQMRPDFKNIPANRSEDVANAFGEGANEDDEDDERNARPVLQQVLLKKKESDRAQSARVQSYAHLQSQEESEPFRKLATYSMTESEGIFNKMYYQDKEVRDAMDEE